MGRSRKNEGIRHIGVELECDGRRGERSVTTAVGGAVLENPAL